MIIMFDVDSTIASIEGCDLLAEKKGVGDTIKLITQQTMDGDMDFDTAFPKKIQLLAPSVAEIQWLSQHYCNNITEGALETIESIRRGGHQVGLISHGFKHSITPMAAELGIEEERVFALEFEHDEKGTYIDIKQSIVAGESGKKRVLLNIKENNQNPQTIFVGDSVSDMKAGEAADCFVGFGGVVERGLVKQAAKNYIYDLRKLEEYIV